MEQALRKDGRAGAKAILFAITKRRAANRTEGQRLRRIARFENELWRKGTLHVGSMKPG